MPAENVIRELRSYEFAEPPRLDPALCDDCAQAIHGRRARADVPFAA
ncbi:MAG: hypothetical protein ABI717_09815 [Actinomycetota bacterium]